MATVGHVSNEDHNTKHIGSPNRLRWLGFRPRSGLWHRKDGRYITYEYCYFGIVLQSVFSLGMEEKYVRYLLSKC